MLSMISRCAISFSSVNGGLSALPRSEEKVFWSSEMRQTSACRVTAQKSPP